MRHLGTVLERQAVSSFRQDPRPNYFSYDALTDTHAAGAIDGTATAHALQRVVGTTAQNTRKVIDAESKMSITASGLVTSGGKASPAWGDPAYFLGAYERRAGLIICATITPTDAKQSGVGWAVKNTGPFLITDFNLIRFDTTANHIIHDEAGYAVHTVCGLYSPGTTYNVWVALRAVGARVYIQGGTYLYPTLLFSNNQGTDATVYPVAMGYDAQITVKPLRVAGQLWLDTPIASDGFDAGTELNGRLTDGNGHNEGPSTNNTIGSGGEGVAWTASANGIWAVSAGKAVGTPSLGPELASGTLSVGSWYQITATQANYFYSTCAIGDTFPATAATVLNASNKVKLINLASMMLTLPTLSPSVIARAVFTIGSRQQAGLVFNLDSASNPQNFRLVIYDHIGDKVYMDEYVAGVRTNLLNAAASYVAGAPMRGGMDGTSFNAWYNAMIINTVTATANTNARGGIFTTSPSNSIDNYDAEYRGTGNEYSILQRI